MVFKNGIKNIQAAAYNGARKLLILTYSLYGKCTVANPTRGKFAIIQGFTT